MQQAKEYQLIGVHSRTGHRQSTTQILSIDLVHLYILSEAVLFIEIKAYCLASLVDIIENLK